MVDEIQQRRLLVLTFLGIQVLKAAQVVQLQTNSIDLTITHFLTWCAMDTIFFVVIRKISTKR
jgi:hypothetical protein